MHQREKRVRSAKQVGRSDLVVPARIYFWNGPARASSATIKQNQNLRNCSWHADSHQHGKYVLRTFCEKVFDLQIIMLSFRLAI